jgi:hypothetical protein
LYREAGIARQSLSSFDGADRPGADRLAVEEAAEVVGQVAGAGVAAGGDLWRHLRQIVSRSVDPVS